MSSPLVSIVVPTLNQAQFIGQTLASIVGQGWPKLELIVVDGGSTDGTAEVVRGFGRTVTHFVSEPDRGQADAINKGLALAQGDILAWLNSDDYYLPCTLDRAVAALGDGQQPSLAYGGTIAHFEAENRAAVWPARPVDREYLKTRAGILQPSAFWTRALWEKTGPLNVDLHFVLDWDWFYRASTHGRFTPIPAPLSIYRFHAGHKTGSGNARRNEEICAFVEQHAGPEWGLAYREVAAALLALGPDLDRMHRFGPLSWRRAGFRDLHSRHGSKVKIALSQLRV
jgi:glycosyltransferase involved in cell wall biosynthesis